MTVPSRTTSSPPHPHPRRPKLPKAGTGLVISCVCCLPIHSLTHSTNIQKPLSMNTDCCPSHLWPEGAGSSSRSLNHRAAEVPGGQDGTQHAVPRRMPRPACEEGGHLGATGARGGWVRGSAPAKTEREGARGCGGVKVGDAATGVGDRWPGLRSPAWV